MGRNPTVPGGLPKLTPKQRELLLMTYAGGHASEYLTEPAAQAWSVRIGGDGLPSVVLTYALSVGRKLIAIGYFAPHPDPGRATIRHPTTGQLIGRRYVVTPAAVARVSRIAAGE